MSDVFAALLLGLSTCYVCALTCLPASLPFVAAGARLDALSRVGLILAGRFLACAAAGAAAGAIGAVLPSRLMQTVSAAGVLGLAVLLFVRAVDVFNRRYHRRCRWMGRRYPYGTARRLGRRSVTHGRPVPPARRTPIRRSARGARRR